MSTPADSSPSPQYATDYRKRWMETADCCVTEFRVSPGQQSPWHFHTATSDLFYVLRGRLDILLAEPDETVQLHAGQSYQVPSGRVHQFVAGQAAGASYLLIQGVGTPDFVTVKV